MTAPAGGGSRMKTSGTLAALVVSVVGGFEGLRQTAYPDPATRGPPWTVCYGETKGVKPGDRYTVEQCRAMLRRSVEDYALGIERCVPSARTMPEPRYTALVSFAYNLGVGGACKSAVVRLINAGHVREGCDALLRYNRAAGIVFPGLTKRRQVERGMCLQGLPA